MQSKGQPPEDAPARADMPQPGKANLEVDDDAIKSGEINFKEPF